MKAKFVHESLVGDILKPKTQDQINNDLSKLSKKDKNNKLLKASWNGQKDVVELLLKAGADVNAITEDGWTPLMMASNGQKDVVELLLKAGADVNAITEDGWTPLMRASWYGHKDIIELLLLAGADVNAIAKDGRTPLMWASAYGHKDLVDLLKKYGAKDDVVSESKRVKKNKIRNPNANWLKHVESIRGMLKDTSSKNY